MSRESAMAAATGSAAPANNNGPITGNTAGLKVSPRQASRVLATESQEASITKSDATKAIQTEGVLEVGPTIENTNPITEPKGLDSDRFAQLAKKEARLQREREALRAEQKAITEAKTRYENVEKQYREFETLKSSDPIAAMKLAGFSDTDIFNFYAQAEQAKQQADSPEAKAAAAAQAEIKKFQDAQDAKALEVQKARDAGVISKFKANINTTISSNKDKYEYCNYYGAQAEQQIYDTVEAVLNQSKGKDLISVQEAADMVEKFYEEQDKAMSSLKKRGSIAPPKQEVVEEVVPAKPKTISNRVAATIASVARANPGKETREQKKQRLIDTIKRQGLTR